MVLKSGEKNRVRESNNLGISIHSTYSYHVLNACTPLATNYKRNKKIRFGPVRNWFFMEQTSTEQNNIGELN